MSADKFREAGFKAIEQRKWPEAIENLSKAIDQSKSPAWLLARSQAFMETGQLDKAIRDAEYAYCTAAERGNDKSRKQMIESQYRRSVCYFRKKEYANADICAVWSQRLAKGVAVREHKTVQQEGVNDKGYYFATAAQAIAEGNENKSSEGNDTMAKLSAAMSGGASDKTPYAKDWNKAQIWRGQILRFLEALPEEDPARKITTTLSPVKPSLEDKKEVKPSSFDPELEAAKKEAAQATSKPDDSKFRTQFYQSDTTITVSIFMKFANKAEMDKVEVRFSEDGKFVLVKGVPRNPPTLYIRFHDLVNVAKSTFRVASMKLELTLAKANPGKWADFGTQSSSIDEFSSVPDWDNSESQANAPPGPIDATPGPSTDKPVTTSTQSSAPKTSAKAPAYPTSSKSGPKDWDNIAKDDDEEEPADVDHFFKQLYKNSTPEQQRAMMKSYTESNGTALSTDWSNVSKGKVETSPPTGMEAKKWDA